LIAEVAAANAELAVYSVDGKYTHIGRVLSLGGCGPNGARRICMSTRLLRSPPPTVTPCSTSRAPTLRLY